MLFNKTIQLYPKLRSNYPSEKDHALTTATVGFMISFEDGTGRLPTSAFKARRSDNKLNFVSAEDHILRIPALRNFPHSLVTSPLLGSNRTVYNVQ